MTAYVRIGTMDYSIDGPGSIALAYEALDAIVRTSKVGKAYLAANPAPGDLRKMAPSSSSSLARLEERLAKVERVADHAALAAAKAAMRPHLRTAARHRAPELRSDTAAVITKAHTAMAKLDRALAQADADHADLAKSAIRIAATDASARLGHPEKQAPPNAR